MPEETLSAIEITPKHYSFPFTPEPPRFVFINGQYARVVPDPTSPVNPDYTTPKDRP